MTDRSQFSAPVRTESITLGNQVDSSVNTSVGASQNIKSAVSGGGLNTQVIVSPELESKILYGQRTTNSQGNTSNRLTGAHSGNISNNNPSFAVETVSVNPDGTRNAKLITQFEDGNLSKIKTSTLFPEKWADTEVISAIKQTGSSNPLATRASDGASLYQSTVNGVKVEVIKIGDNVTAGYPCGKGCTSSEAFEGK